MKGYFLMFLLMILGILISDEQIPPENRDCTFSIVYPISTNKTKLDSTNLNLSLIQNSVGEVRGLNLCLFSAISKKSVKGVQTSLLYSQIDDNLKGISLSTVNVVNDEIKGVQIGICANIIGKSFSGYQVANIVNFVGGNFSGYQQSSVYNIVGQRFSGLQLAAAGNVVGSNFNGVQLASTFNFVGKILKGVQMSGVNICGKSKGLQFGWGNIAQINRGCQFGIINIAEEQQGVPVGLVNLSDDGDVQWQNYISNFAGFVTAIRFKSNNFISTIELGGPNLESNIDESVLMGFHYGYHIPLQKFGLESDLGFFHIIYEPEDNINDIPNNFALQLRFAGTYRILNWLELFAGLGVTAMGDYEFEDEASNEETEDRFLYFMGINLF